MARRSRAAVTERIVRFSPRLQRDVDETLVVAVCVRVDVLLEWCPDPLRDSPGGRARRRHVESVVRAG